MTEERASCNCKVGTLIDKYDLNDLNETLVDEWTGQHGDAKSVRALTASLNTRVVRRTMAAAGIELIDGRAENVHRLLTDDATLDAVKLQLRQTLTNEGVDVDALQSDIVSHQTVYRHLTNCLDATKETNTLSIDNERDRVNQLQNRSEAVITDAVSRLKDGRELEIGAFQVLVNFRVTCETCGRSYDVDALLSDGGCGCAEST